MRSVHAYNLVCSLDNAHVLPVYFFPSEARPPVILALPYNVPLLTHDRRCKEQLSRLRVVVIERLVAALVERLDPRARRLHRVILVLLVNSVAVDCPGTCVGASLPLSAVAGDA